MKAFEVVITFKRDFEEEEEFDDSLPEAIAKKIWYRETDVHGKDKNQRSIGLTNLTKIQVTKLRSVARDTLPNPKVKVKSRKTPLRRAIKGSKNV